MPRIAAISKDRSKHWCNIAQKFAESLPLSPTVAS
jgi:hypothetical protein